MALQVRHGPGCGIHQQQGRKIIEILSDHEKGLRWNQIRSGIKGILKTLLHILYTETEKEEHTQGSPPDDREKESETGIGCTDH